MPDEPIPSQFRAHARAADPRHEAIVLASAARSAPVIAVPTPSADDAEADRLKWLAWLGQKTSGVVTSLDDGQEAAQREVYGLNDLAAEVAALRKSLEQSDAAIGFLLEPADADVSEPENHFADLMLADETVDDAKARLSARLKELRHYLIAPEIKVNEDGSVGLTAGEQSELQDLERRQTLGRWLDA